jgi:hypothetical protein
MEPTFDALDAFAFVVLAVILIVAVVIVVSLGQLPGRLARQWGHPQAAAITVAGWIGIATAGLVWPLALIWAFTAPSDSSAAKIQDARQAHPKDRP